MSLLPPPLAATLHGPGAAVPPFNQPLTVLATNASGATETFHGFHDGAHWRAYDLPAHGVWYARAWAAGYADDAAAATPIAGRMRLLPACEMHY